MRVFNVAVALTALVFGGGALADDLTNAKAEELLAPFMDNQNCGNYYTTQGEPQFADIDSKAMCTYKPRVTRLSVNGSTAKADYNKDRLFGDAMSQAWLKDYAQMEADEAKQHETPSLLFRTLKAHLDKWRAEAGGLDHGPRPASATFKLNNGIWKVDSAPQE